MVSQQFQDVNADRWECIKAMMAHEANILIEHDSGSGESHGIQFDWLYAAPGVLTVTISVPHFGFVLKMAGLHCEQDVMDSFAKKINAIA